MCALDSNSPRKLQTPQYLLEFLVCVCVCVISLQFYGLCYKKLYEMAMIHYKSFSKKDFNENKASFPFFFLKQRGFFYNLDNIFF